VSESSGQIKTWFQGELERREKKAFTFGIRQIQTIAHSEGERRKQERRDALHDEESLYRAVNEPYKRSHILGLVDAMMPVAIEKIEDVSKAGKRFEALREKMDKELLRVVPMTGCPHAYQKMYERLLTDLHWNLGCRSRQWSTECFQKSWRSLVELSQQNKDGWDSSVYVARHVMALLQQHPKFRDLQGQWKNAGL
jgi:hypothetical protein